MTPGVHGPRGAAIGRSASVRLVKANGAGDAGGTSPDAIPAYRSSVGMAGGYDLMGGMQFALLVGLGLREHHTLCDVGCGSLRAGRLLIPYLERGHYFGVEPSKWKIEEGIGNEVGRDLVETRAPTFGYFDDLAIESFDTPFDFVLAQSVFSHTYRDLTSSGLEHVRNALAPTGVLVATFYETRPLVLPVGQSDRPDDGSGFRTSLCVAYTWKEWSNLVEQAGMTCRRMRWHHKRQTWFLAARTGNEDRLRAMAQGVKTRLLGPGQLGYAVRRARRRLARATS